MLELREVRVARGGTEVLRGVALAVQPGEVLAVIGPNGAGKSTLLHVLSGALRPDHGIAALDGVPLARLPRDELARRRAVLPQASVLSFPFRVREVVHLGRSPHRGRSTHGEDERAVEAAMRQAEVMHLADRIYTTLSGVSVNASIWPVYWHRSGCRIARRGTWTLPAIFCSTSRPMPLT